MGVRLTSGAAASNVGAQVGGNTEGAILTVGPISPPLGDAVVLIVWYFSWTQGSIGATGVIPRIRRGSGTGGTQINATVTVPLAAATTGILSGSFVDIVSLGANLLYTLTGQGVANSGTNPGWNDASLIAFIL